MTKLWNRTFVRQTIALLFVLSLAITVMACNGNGDDDDKTPRATLADHVVDALDNLDEDDDPDELEDLLIKEGVLPANAEAITEEFEDKLEDAEDAGLTREAFIEKVSDLLGDLDDDKPIALNDIKDAFKDAVRDLKKAAAAQPTTTPASRTTPEASKAEDVKEDLLDDIDALIKDAKGDIKKDLQALRIEIEKLSASKVMAQKDALLARIKAATGSDKEDDSGDKPSWLGSQCVLAPNIPTMSEKVKTVYTSAGSLAYPDMVAADPSRSSSDFPDDVVNGVKPLVGYDVSFQNGDYFEDCAGDTDVPQYYWRVETTGYFYIPASKATNNQSVVCIASEKKGCVQIIINHYGPTMKLNGVYDDNGFTVAGPVWNMEKPSDVTAAAQVLIDHYVHRMIYGDGVAERNDGTNCSVIEGCESVEWHVTVFGNGELQKHWAGLYTGN